MSSDRRDEELTRKAQQGDHESFMMLYSLYLGKVHNRVRSRVPYQDVEDVVQDIFVAVIRSLDGFEQRSHFGTWLYTIVNRQIADFYRRRSRSKGREDEKVSLADLERVPDERIADRDQLDESALLQQALRSLPEHYQDIIMMRHEQRLTFAEIARRRNQTLEAVKSLYRRAIQALRDRTESQ